MPISAVKNPIWHDAAKTVLDMEVSIDDGNSFVPYTAHPDSEIYRDVLAGKYGPIGSREIKPPTKEQLALHAQTVSQRIANGGISIPMPGQSPAEIDTHPNSLAAIARNLQLGSLNPQQKFDWVQRPSSLVLNVTQMQAIAKAAYAHEQACWSTLNTVYAQIDSGAITSKAEIDAAAWPKNS
jgi:hypothetical protein